MSEANYYPDDFGADLETVVARIRALPPNPNSIRPAIGSLAEALAASKDAEFDLASWEAAWLLVEEELAAMERADNAKLELLIEQMREWQSQVGCAEEP